MADDSLPADRARIRPGIEIADTMQTTATTIRSSISVKPAVLTNLGTVR